MSAYEVPQSHLPTHTKHKHRAQRAPIVEAPETPRTQRLWDLMRSAKMLLWDEHTIPAGHWLAPVEAPAWWLAGYDTEQHWGVENTATAAELAEGRQP